MMVKQQINNALPVSIETRGASKEGKTPTLGKTIRKLRKQLKMTQEDLAFETGISDSYISKIEADKKLPTINQIKKISNVLGVEYFELILTTTDEDKIKSNDKKQLFKELINNFNKLNEIEDYPHDSSFVTDVESTTVNV